MTEKVNVCIMLIIIFIIHIYIYFFLVEPALLRAVISTFVILLLFINSYVLEIS